MSLNGGRRKEQPSLRAGHILITGGGGFLGQAIVRLLRKEGVDVRTLNRNHYPELEELKVEQIQGDIADFNVVERACRGMDLVFHVAAKPGIWGSYSGYFNPNVIGTRNIITACRSQGIRYLVHTSSPSVAYNDNAVEGGDESIPYPERYLTNYQKTKALAERAVIQASDDSLKTIVLRPRLIWGPGDNHLIPRILARADKLVRVGNGRNLVDTIYIDNAAEAHVLAAEKLQQNHALSGKVYFISQDDPIALWEMINRILEAGGKPPVTQSMPAGLAYALGALIELAYRLLGLSREPKMTRFLSLELSQPHWFDITAAKRDLGYRPGVSIDEGLERLKSWLKSHQSGSKS
jgi:nucleoside-diphosphate-sugar epimerase